MELIVDRIDYTTTATTGVLHVKPECKASYQLGFTLEDARRFPGVKVNGDTCIPAGRYRVGISRSNRFGRDMTIIYNCSNGYELQAEAISFTGIRMHGGNTSEHTSGCILVAEVRVNDHKIQGSIEKTVTNLVKRAIEKEEEVWLCVND